MELPIIIKINLNSKNNYKYKNRIKKSKNKSILQKYYNSTSKTNLYEPFNNRNYKLIYPTIYEHPDE